ncbi:MAG TPA: hypothetical protein PK801_00875 [Aggregatilineales bacterium]|nr:hypothetical protein [Aggregatilineales bacterium]
MRRSPILLILLAACLPVLVTGCAVPELDLNVLFPAEVGSFTRTAGPGIDEETGVDVAVYEAAEGTVTLRVRQVATEQVERALATLPPSATDVGPDPGLGQRDGVFFTFASQFHAAWANGDWVFVLSADTDLARRAFLASYSY